MFTILDVLAAVRGVARLPPDPVALLDSIG